jgi:hypothetical protein
MTFSYTFPFTFAVNAVNGSYGIWTSLKMILTPLNFNRYQLLKNLREIRTYKFREKR